MLVLNFNSPTTALNVNFSLEPFSPTTSDALLYSLSAVFSKDGDPLDAVSVESIFSLYDPPDPIDPTLGVAFGSLDYQGLAFDKAELLFSTDAPYFFVDSVSYTPAPVPEPATVLLFGTGLVGLLGYRLRGKKS